VLCLLTARACVCATGSASFGVCKGKNVPPHGYIAGVAIFAGDGTLDTIPIVTNAVQEGRYYMLSTLCQRGKRSPPLGIDRLLPSHAFAHPFYLIGGCLGRRKGRMSTNDVVTVELDLDQHHVSLILAHQPS